MTASDHAEQIAMLADTHTLRHADTTEVTPGAERPNGNAASSAGGR